VNVFLIRCTGESHYNNKYQSLNFNNSIHRLTNNINALLHLTKQQVLLNGGQKLNAALNNDIIRKETTT